MTVGFDTGAKWFDHYMEAYYEVIECYFDALDEVAENSFVDYSGWYDTIILPAAKELADSLDGIYANDYSIDYYENYFHNNFFVENAWETIWDWETILDGNAHENVNCDIGKILDRWGFESRSIQDVDSVNSDQVGGGSDGIIVAPQKYIKKTAHKFDDFDPIMNKLRIDIESFNLEGSPSFAAAKNRKAIKKQLAKQDIDFLYDQKKGGLYFNENGLEKGFGDGGIIAILKGAPDLTESNLEFI